MSFALSPEIERRIHEQMTLGRYASPEDLLLDALKLVKNKDFETLKDNLQKLKEDLEKLI